MNDSEIVDTLHGKKLKDKMNVVIDPDDRGNVDILPDSRETFFSDIGRNIVVGTGARAGHLLGKTVTLSNGEGGAFTAAISATGFERVVLGEQCVVLNDICSPGEVKVGRAGRIGKNIFCGRAEVHRQTQINGNVLATGDIAIASDCDVNGALISLEGSVTVGDRCNIGMIYAKGNIRMGQDISLMNDIISSSEGKVVFPSDGEDPVVTLAHTFSVIKNELIPWEELAAYCFTNTDNVGYNLSKVIFKKDEKIITRHLKHLEDKWKKRFVMEEMENLADGHGRKGPNGYDG